MSDNTPAAGSMIFGYAIERELGKGGMGTVYLATQTSLGRQVALKVLHPGRVRNPKAADEFFREAAAAAKLSHPNLVGVHDLQADTLSGLYAYSMEYVPGVTAWHVVQKQGPMAMNAALHLVYQVANALAYAHRQGFVHRDVKPENILVTAGTTAKLLDLGLAYNRLGSVGSGDRGSNRRLALVGTVDYAAPEQSRNPDNATAASDVWGLGATLYYLITGKPPFDGETVIDLIVRTATEDLALPDGMANHHRELFALMMAKDPDDRIADGDELVTVLQQVAKGERPRLPERTTDDSGSQEVLAPAAGGGAPQRRRRIRRRRTR